MRTRAALAAAFVCASPLAACSDEPSPTNPAAPPISSISTESLDPAARRYLDAVANRDADALAAAFALDAVVIDVSRQIRGRDAIRTWAAAEVIGGIYTLLGNTPRPGGTTMLVRFQPGGTGGFNANYSFDIADNLITRADLQYA
ncbi:nuclear transport factor 2 family protein [Nocardia sp. NPDC058666]|uniref:nuclear transport factor 2 family protein n=1 Tax=Nocardia sp. NPDC058666 TaxID=3346587 RepID=UPI003653F77A